MCKKEKLSAFLEAFSWWHTSNATFRDVITAWEEYLATPDDPQSEAMKTHRITYRDSDGRRHTEYGTFTRDGLATHLEELEEGGCRNINVTAMP